jgi:predicted RNA-binding protein with PUA-like domain
MNHWILKTEPSTYSFDDLLKDKKATWDGVKNPQALANIRSMKIGDPVMIYHTGEEKRIVGLAEIVSEPYADPKLKDPRMAVVDLVTKKKLSKEVSLAEIKVNPKFKDLKLVRQSRLSVIPVPEPMWKDIMKMAGEK